MKLLRYGSLDQEKPGIIDTDGNIRSLEGVIDDVDGGVLSEDNLKRLQTLDLTSLPIIDAGVRIGACINKVGKFICVGLNYADHAAESGMAVPSEPVLFMKATSSIIGPNDAVVMPPKSEKSDWEVELGVVIGKETKYISEEDALDHIAGYCVINDLSEREFQIEKEGQWCKGKGCDTFGPIGPYLVTTDEVTDSNELDIWLELNGEMVQDGNTRTMVYKIPFLVSYISQFMSLQPGDIISTGTPPGVGLGFTPPKYLKEGDVMRLGISGLGEQQQTVERYKA
jgi:ureidoglycolate lyase/2,4-diketo-3-deoxy-L-fuconate hydrolase